MAALRLSEVPAYGQTRRGVAARFQVFEMAMRMSRLPFRGRTEHRRDVVVSFHVRLGGEVEVASVGLRLPCESVLEVLFGLAALDAHGRLLKCWSGRRLPRERKSMKRRPRIRIETQGGQIG